MVEKSKEEQEDQKTDFEIIEEDFKMCYNGGTTFDLYFRYKKKKSQEEDWKLGGYGMQLSNCVKKIAYHRIGTKYSSMTFKEFFVELKKTYDEVTALLKEATGHGY